MTAKQKSIGVQLVVLATFALVRPLQAVETNTFTQAQTAARTNLVETNATTDENEQRQLFDSLPRLQPREHPASDLQIPSSAEQVQLPARAPALRGMAPRRLRLGDTNGPTHFDPRQWRTNQSAITSRRAPASVLKDYDRDKNGLLDSAEWYQYRQDLEKRRIERERLQIGTNAPPSTVSTNKTENP